SCSRRQWPRCRLRARRKGRTPLPCAAASRWRRAIRPGARAKVPPPALRAQPRSLRTSSRGQPPAKPRRASVATSCDELESRRSRASPANHHLVAALELCGLERRLRVADEAREGNAFAFAQPCEAQRRRRRNAHVAVAIDRAADASVDAAADHLGALGV